MHKRIELPNNVTAYLDDQGKLEAAFQDFPIFDEDDPSEIIGCETVALDSKDLMKTLKGCDNMNKRRAIIDDGMNPELVYGADFDGYLGIPIIHRPNEFIIPTDIVPFTKRGRLEGSNVAVGFYEMDDEFSDVLIRPEEYIDEFKRNTFVTPENIKLFISPDCSLYRNAPLAVQIANVYRNRAIGFYYQRNGAYVIPQIRWGNALTYTTSVLPERVAFLGVEKQSIVAIGTYGCFKTRDDKYHFEAGLAAMMETLEPRVVLVYGSMNEKVFGPYLESAQFVSYPDWITRVKGGDC